MTFYVKRPGQYEGDPVPPEGADPGGHVGALDAMTDDWSLHLPHRCDAWEIGYGTREEVLADAVAFRVGLDRAIAVLEQGEEQR